MKSIHHLGINLSLVTTFTIAMFLLSCAKTQKAESINPISGEEVIIHSNILGEDRKVYIYAPVKDSLNPDKAYHVVYVLDGDNHAALVAEYCQYLSRGDVSVIPPIIVIGIPNTDRTRDLTPTHSNFDYTGRKDTNPNSRLRTSGGNDKFFSFLREEVMPYVSSHYKTHPFRILAGHSFGGLTAINCLLTYPDMFDAYIAASPSLWWDREYMFPYAAKKLTTGSTLQKILFCSDGSEGSYDSSTFHINLLKFDTLLKQKQIKKLDYQYVYYPAENHMTVPIKTYYDGLRFIYKQWEVPIISDTLVNANFIETHYRALSEKYKYTVLPDEINIDNMATSLLNNASTWDNGISLLELNCVNYPKSYKAFTSLGDAYVRTGKKQKAIDCYKKAISINPKGPAKEKLLQLEKDK